MALFGSHIRLALDLKDQYRVTDLNQYLSGTVYPDSRYYTGIKRTLTHSEEYLKESFWKDNDFRKGWMLHIVCDLVQSKIAKAALPEIFTDEVHQGNDMWVVISAIKAIQEIEDLRHYDIRGYLPCLGYVQNPHGEDLNKLREYNQILQRLYANGFSLEHRIRIWQAIGVPGEIVKKIRSKAAEFMADERMVSAINKFYPEILEKSQVP